MKPRLASNVGMLGRGQLSAHNKEGLGCKGAARGGLVRHTSFTQLLRALVGLTAIYPLSAMPSGAPNAPTYLRLPLLSLGRTLITR